MKKGVNIKEINTNRLNNIIINTLSEIDIFDNIKYVSQLKNSGLQPTPVRGFPAI